MISPVGIDEMSAGDIIINESVFMYQRLTREKFKFAFCSEQKIV